MISSASGTFGYARDDVSRFLQSHLLARRRVPQAYYLVKELERKHSGPISTLLFVGDNRVWSGSWDRTFCVWGMPTR
jgi:hypothetical protein